MIKEVALQWDVYHPRVVDTEPDITHDAIRTGSRVTGTSGPTQTDFPCRRGW